MQVLLVGNGAREHALAWGLARSPIVDGVVATPGNPGISQLGPCLPFADAMESLDAFDLAVIGPEAPLVDGLADELRERGLAVFGPSGAASQLEGSKAWMKAVLAKAGVPTAGHATFRAAEEGAALAYLETLPGLYVIKTDGLAAGKGVLVTESIAEARDGVREYLAGRAFGEAGRTVVIEEGLTGPELSLLVLCDGSLEGVPLAPAQDFKRVGDADAGPNTGGMGAYSPVPIASADVIDTIMELAVTPTLAALGQDGIDYRGVLYAGLMLTPDGPKVIEYNVRFGDPECEVVVPRLASDLAVHCSEAATGRLQTPVVFRGDACVSVVLASPGYPSAPETDQVIAGVEAAAALDDVMIFHAGTKQVGDDLVTAGGRVLAVTALGADIPAARARAYEAADLISWPGLLRRSDIAASVT